MARTEGEGHFGDVDGWWWWRVVVSCRQLSNRGFGNEISEYSRRTHRWSGFNNEGLWMVRRWWILFVQCHGEQYGWGKSSRVMVCTPRYIDIGCEIESYESVWIDWAREPVESSERAHRIHEENFNRPANRVIPWTWMGKNPNEKTKKAVIGRSR